MTRVYPQPTAAAFGDGTTLIPNVGRDKTVVSAAIIQTASAKTTSTTTVTLASAPTPGNYLLFLVGGFRNGSWTVPSGLTTIVDSSGLESFNAVSAYYRKVVAGDPSSYSFTGSGQGITVTVIEIASIIGTFTYSTGTLSAAGNPIVPTFPSGVGTFAFVVIENDSQGSYSQSSSGWTTLWADTGATSNHSAGTFSYSTSFSSSPAALSVSYSGSFNGSYPPIFVSVTVQ